MSALVGLLASAWLVAAAQVAPGRLVSVRATCSGPLAGFELRWPDGSAARVTLDLRAGEVRELDVLLPLPATGASGAPERIARGGGEVRLVQAIPERAQAVAEAWARVPTGLRLRPAPPAPGYALPPERLPPGALLAGAASLALVWGLRARPRAALGAGLVGAALGLWLARPAARAPAALEVLEGDGTAWVLVRAARSRLTLESGVVERLECTPSEAPLAVSGVAAADGVRWEAHAPGARLVARRALADVPAQALRGDANGLEDLVRCWVRGDDGLWSHRGAWTRGAALPAAAPGPAPPAALVVGLPAGRGVLLAERERGERTDSTGAWLRLVGFEAGAGDRD